MSDVFGALADRAYVSLSRSSPEDNLLDAAAHLRYLATHLRAEAQRDQHALAAADLAGMLVLTVHRQLREAKSVAASDAKSFCPVCGEEHSPECVDEFPEPGDIRETGR